MKVSKTPIPDLLVIKPEVFHDERGFFLETFKKERYKKKAGINLDFIQDNHSRSSKNVLRGLHFQKKFPQGKLVKVVSGKVLDVAVDIRYKSKTFGKWFGVELSEENKKQFWIPPGFAHGFLTLSTFADLEYKCTDYLPG